MRLLLLFLALAACGDLPAPFMGNPGATARRLAVPAAPMLAVPLPDALLSPAGARDFADLLALKLQRDEVPALARQPRKTDWSLGVTASRRDTAVIPRYAILDPSGRELGGIDGAAFPAPEWTDGRLLARATEDAVPKIIALMSSIKATRDRADPASLLNRIPVLYVPEVTGAPGDGNQALTRLIRSELKQFGPLVQVTPESADFTVQGAVATGALPKGQQRIEIIWTVTRPNGGIAGKVSQINAIPAGSLGQSWGEVAVVVSREAASGIFTVVERFAGREHQRQ